MSTAMLMATTATAPDLPGSAERLAVPLRKTLMTLDGRHCCSTFRVAAGGVHECDHEGLVLPEDVTAACERAQQQEGSR